MKNMSLRPLAPGASAVPIQNRLHAVLSAGRREMQQQPSAPVGDVDMTSMEDDNVGSRVLVRYTNGTLFLGTIIEVFKTTTGPHGGETFYHVRSDGGELMYATETSIIARM